MDAMSEVQSQLSDIHDRIQNCPNGDTEQILIILERLVMAIQTLASKAISKI